VILVAKPSFIFKTEGQEFPWHYTLVPLLSAFCLGVLYVVQRRLAAHVNTNSVSFYIGVAQVFAGLAWQVISGDDYAIPLCYLPRILLIVCPLCLMVVWVAANLALKFEGAATASIVRNLDTVLAFFVQVFVFGVPAEALSLVGASLIMGGTIILALSKMFNIDCGIKF
jgi:drug/metabolite transporter (DMT)-like permease